jgi:hypothetical protein
MSLLGMLNPLFSVHNGYLTDFDQASPMFYQGAQTIPFLLVCALGLGLKDKLAPNKKWIAAILIATIIFTLFGLGPNTFVYPMTYGIPVWSSLRWCNRFLLFSTFGLGICAFAASELYIGYLYRYRWVAIAVSVSCLCATGILFYFYPPHLLSNPAAYLSLFAGLASFLLLPLLDKRGGLHAFLIFSLASSVANVAFAHELGYKTYSIEDEPVTAESFGIDSRYRILPISHDMQVPPRKNEYGQFSAPTENGYWNLTGQTTLMMPLAFRELIPSQIDGIIDSPALENLLGSNLLRAWGVRYLIVGKTDIPHLNWIKRNDGYIPIKELKNVITFESKQYLPTAFFASQVIPFDGPSFYRGAVLNESPLTTVFAEGHSWQNYDFNADRVLSAEWDPSGLIQLQLQAQKPGFLVVSAFFSKGWSATIDGNAAPLIRVDQSILGIEIPANAKTVVLDFTVKGLALGLWLALLGFMIFLTNVRMARAKGTV